MDVVLLLPLGLVLLNVYALALVMLRGPVFRTRVYRPMLLNIGLSVAPTVVMLLTFVAELVVVEVLPRPWAVWAVLVVGGVIWLLLLPNAAYLLTELNLSHRRPGEDVPLWYDIVLVLTLALSGVANTLANVALAQLVAMGAVAPSGGRDALADGVSWAIVAAILVLVSFGIYLGRYIRFNSWDLAHPASFVRKLTGHLRVPAQARAAAAFTATHAVLLAILYLVAVVPVLLLTLG